MSGSETVKVKGHTVTCKNRGGVEIQPTLSSSWALEGVGGQRRIVSDLALGKRDGTLLLEGGRVKGPVWVGVQTKTNVFPQPGLQPEPFMLQQVAVPTALSGPTKTERGPQ
jgi:hypothetical protein